MDYEVAPRRVPALAGGLAGAALLAVAASPRYAVGLASPVDTRLSAGTGRAWWTLLAIGMVATLAALCLTRWWPYLLLAGGLLGVPGLLTTIAPASYAGGAAVPLVLVATLAAAQSLARAGAAGWGAAVAGTAVGAQLFGAAQVGAGWLLANPGLPGWHLGLTAVGLAGAAVAVWAYPRGDVPVPARWRYLAAGTLAAGVGAVPAVLTEQRTARILAVSENALFRHGSVMVAAVGLAVLVTGVLLAALAGAWALAGGLTAATVQVGVVAPMILAVYALAFHHPLRWAAALAGVVLGAVAAASRWRVQLAAGGAVLCAVVLVIAYAATTGMPEKVVDQQRVVPAGLLLVLLAATATALAGGTLPVLARQGAAPAVLGPVVAVLVAGGGQALEATYLRDGVAESSYLAPVHHVTTSAVLLLVAAGAIGGLKLAEVLAARRAERRMTELVRRQATEAERNRLARPIHDGVLQVLALVQRHGPELGGRGVELARLAGAQEVALRALITSEGPPEANGSSSRSTADLRSLLAELATPTVEFAEPAAPVTLPAHAAREVRDAVAAALDNVRRHAGPAACAWVLVEDEPDAVLVTVRDNGCGIADGRLAQAAADGRLGVAQSMRGRIADLGGTTTINSRPGDGTEVEFRVPR